MLPPGAQLCVLPFLLFVAMEIITLYEIVQGLTHNMTVLGVLIGAGMIYLGAVGIFYQRALMGDAELMQELVPIWVLCGMLVLSGIGLLALMTTG